MTHVLLNYYPTYSTFTAADNILVPSGERQLIALIFPSFKSLRDISAEGSDAVTREQVDEDAQSEGHAENQELNREIDLAFEHISPDLSNNPSTSGRVDLSIPEDDIFIGLEDLPGTESEAKKMGGESLAQFARRRDAERIVARRQGSSFRGSQVTPTREVPLEETARQEIVAEFVPEPQTKVIEVDLQGQK